MYGFVYKTTNNINGMCYIGKCVYSRKNSWESYLGSGVYLKRAINKYGRENFTKEIIAEADSEDELRIIEELYIEKYNAVTNERFYNIKYTSIGGDTFTNNPNKEAIRILKSNNALGIKNPQYSKEKTQNFKDVIAKVNSREVEIEGITYSSITKASKELDILLTTISFRLDSDGFPTYIRKVPKNKVTKHNNNKPRKIHIQGTEYKSIAEAARTLGCSSAKIRGRVGFDPDYFYIE